MNEQSKTLRERSESTTRRSGKATQPALPLRPRREPTALDNEVLPVAEADVALPDNAADPGPGAEAPARALALSDLSPAGGGPLDAFMRYAYRLGLPGSVLSSPFRKAEKARLLAEVTSPIAGDRRAGMSLRAGHLLVNGMKAPVGQLDFLSSTRLVPPFRRAVHGFHWMRDLAAAARPPEAARIARPLFQGWQDANSEERKGPAWSIEHTGHRLLNWLMFAPAVLLADGEARGQILPAVERTARWLDRAVRSAPDLHGETIGWGALVAAGLLLPQGRPRQLYAEAGLIKALGELVGEDGGVVSRSPLAQIDLLTLLVDLRACYEAVEQDWPAPLDAVLSLLVPPLLALRHGDGGLGSWQGAGAVSAARAEGLIEASGVRARPGRDLRQWGYQRVTARDTVLQFDAAPPPRSKHARFGCASTLAFELSSGPDRVVVNCGGAELAGGLAPVRIEKGLRATAAHSTLVLDDANSTAILVKGRIGKGVAEVDISRSHFQRGPVSGTRLRASHDGYASRFGLLHERVLMLRDTGAELHGEDLLVPVGRKGQRGKIGYAIRFHLAPHIAATLSQDGRGARLALPDGGYWQFRLGGDDENIEVSIDESLWVDGDGRPHATSQLVVTGLVSRGGGRFPWLLRKVD
jgi:uncharacterized heparinase superfamily protein